MPTTKARINLTVPADINEFLVALAKRDSTTISAKVMELIEIALDAEEDKVLGKLAEERDTEDAKWIAFEDMPWV